MLTERDLERIEGSDTTPRPRIRSTAAAAWDREHLRTITTKLTTPQAQRLRVLCMLEGTSPYRLMQDYLTEWIRRVEMRQDPRDLAAAREILDGLGWDLRRVRS